MEQIQLERRERRKSGRERFNPKARVLAFYPCVPYPLNRGAHQRFFHLLKALAARYRVDLVALAENCEGAQYHDIFGQFCDRVEVIPFEHPPWGKLFPKRLKQRLPSTVMHWALPQVAGVLRRTLAAGTYHAVHVGDAVLAQYFLTENQRVPVILDRTRVDLQYQWMEYQRLCTTFKSRLLSWENWVKLWFYERRVASRVRVEVVCGPDDESFLRRYVSRDLPVAVIPNGVDLEFFNPDRVSETSKTATPTILFCGAMDYAPNVDALRWYFDEIHPSLRKVIPNLRLNIVGKDPVEAVRAYSDLPDVVITGGVPDVRPYYAEAWLQLVPLRIGGGTRLKIVESMAMGTPVVSTSIGAQGLGLRHGHDVLIADDALSFVRESARALQDRELRRSLGAQGMETVQSRLSWTSLGAALGRVYTERIEAG